jgi:hypothetical protein
MVSAVTQSRLTPIVACSQCGITDKKLSVCARCLIEKYCSRVCQSVAWPLHKLVCVHVKKETTSQSTRASIDVKPMYLAKDPNHDFLVFHGVYATLKIDF